MVLITPEIIIILGIVVLGVWSLKQLRENFSERLFFLIGMWLFIIQGTSSTYGLIIEWNLLPVWIIITRISSLLFNFLIAYFFYYLKSKAPASMGGAGTTLTAEEVNEFLKNETK